MTDAEPNDRLSRISTLWSLVDRAHAASPSEAGDAQRELLERYCGAVYRYLVAAVRSDVEAMDLFQEFALKFVRGDFHRADPARGRFRDYLKSSLINLVHDFHRRRKADPKSLPAQLADPHSAEDDEDLFLASWREELLQRAWDALQREHATYHAVLLAHVQSPESTAAEIAAQLQSTADRPLTPGNVRVLLHRARGRFAQLLRAEVAQSIGEEPGEEATEIEARALGIAPLCREPEAK